MKKILYIFVFSLIISTFGISTANAITVDGLVSPASEWNAALTGGIYAIDPEETTINDNYDIEAMYAWWNTTTVYVRADVYGIPTLAKLDSGNAFPAFYQWSIDTNKDGISDLDLVYNYADLGQVRLYLGGNFTPAGLLGYGTGAYNDVVEVSFAQSLVPSRLEPTTNYNVGMYLRLDNAGDDPDDRLPGLGYKYYTPEPTSMFMLGLGLFGFAGGVIRKRFKA